MARTAVLLLPSEDPVALLEMTGADDADKLGVKWRDTVWTSKDGRVLGFGWDARGWGGTFKACAEEDARQGVDKPRKK
jgi:hypothetical protein